MPNWPYPHNRLERRTYIANLYRDRLFEADPHACYDLDALLDHYGQHWITGNRPPMNPDEPMTATQIAEWTDSTIQAITNRIAKEHIRPAGRRNGRQTYWLADFKKPSSCVNTLV
jgi:hypothetical protein